MVPRSLFEKSFAFDTSKLPPELQALTSDELTHHFRAVFDFAVTKAHDHEVALEISYELLFRLTTSRRWSPTEGPLREHLLGMVIPVYTELRFGGSREERDACVGFTLWQGKVSGSPEDFALYVESQPDLDREDAADDAALSAVIAAVANSPLERRVLGVWAEQGPGIPPREIASLLDVPVKDVHRAIERIRRHARSHKVRNARARARGAN